MKSARRHDLQTNELADAIGRVIARLRPHGRLLFYAAVLLVLALVVLVLWWTGPSQAELARRTFAHALGAADTAPLREFLEKYPEASEAPIARLTLADRLLARVVRGVDVQGNPLSAAQADRELAEAKEKYRQVAAASARYEPLARLKLALATVQEGDLDQGREMLQGVAKNWPHSEAAASAAFYIERLKDYRPIEFPVRPPQLEPAAPAEPAAGAAGDSPREPAAGAAGDSPREPAAGAAGDSPPEPAAGAAGESPPAEPPEGGAGRGEPRG